MTFKSYGIALFLRVLFLGCALAALSYGVVKPSIYIAVCGGFLTLVGFVNLYRYVHKRFTEVADFFESVKYRDFSRWFSETHGTKDMQELHKGFNLVNATIKSINSERQAQLVYLQKILEMVDVGILAYNLNSGDVLWINESMLQILDLPRFKNIGFVERRRSKMYDELFDTYHNTAVSVKLEVHKETIKTLISDTVFQVEEQSFKLIVLQNIEETLNRNESEAWKKLLSVMTHEIMNSIAPITSLAETLQGQVEEAIESPQNTIELEDLGDGIKSIKKRSEGLMKFAQTYRSLNKVTRLNRSTIKSQELFENISILMQPSLQQRDIELVFKTAQPDVELDIDVYLLEQVLINLILNAIDACAENPEGKVEVFSGLSQNNHPQITVVDNGKGIPAEIMDTIFVPFYSTKKTGSGIGLSLCKQIMTLHGGKVQVQSEEGEGAIMKLIF